MTTRRHFLKTASAATAALATTPTSNLLGSSPPTFGLGLVTYNWGKNWDLPTLIKNCEATGFTGLELRSTHAHGVEPGIPESEKAKINALFATSPVSLVGLGSACEYHSPDPAVLRKNIEETHAFAQICHDVGGTGVKVRPNSLPKEIPSEKTIEQIGKALNEVAAHAYGLGVEIRVEVHGKETKNIPTFAQIMDVADHPNVVVCWNCNQEDLITSPGASPEDALLHNYEKLKDRISTVHIHDLRSNTYPWEAIFKLLQRDHFTGWALLEEGKIPDGDEAILVAMQENREIWDRLTTN